MNENALILKGFPVYAGYGKYIFIDINWQGMVNFCLIVEKGAV
jgi:hypothetical protein